MSQSYILFYCIIVYYVILYYITVDIDVTVLLS